VDSTVLPDDVGALGNTKKKEQMSALHNDGPVLFFSFFLFF
jgi:hypothetical protein